MFFRKMKISKIYSFFIILSLHTFYIIIMTTSCRSPSRSFSCPA